MSGQDVATRSPAQEVVAQVRSDDFKQQVALALPEGVPARRFVRATVTALLQNPDIANANLNSIFQSLLRAAQDGLLPDGREAALVVFKTKEGPKAQYLPMIGGLRKIAADYGWSLRTEVVYEHDHFEYELGAEPHLEHRPPRPGIERGEKIAAYAVARHKSQPTEFEVMDAAEIEKVRQTSRAKDYGPWVDWEERMWEKTVGKRLFAKLPLGERDHERINRVLNVDELEPGEAATLIYGPQANGEPARAIEAPQPLEEDSRAAAEASPVAAQPAGGTEADAAPDEPFDGEEPGEESQFKPPTAAQEATGAGLVEITFGRHKGRTLQQVYDDDPAGNDRMTGKSYIAWLAGESVKDEGIRASAKTFLKGLSS